MISGSAACRGPNNSPEIITNYHKISNTAVLIARRTTIVVLLRIPAVRSFHRDRHIFPHLARRSQRKICVNYFSALKDVVGSQNHEMKLRQRHLQALFCQPFWIYVRICPIPKSSDVLGPSVCVQNRTCMKNHLLQYIPCSRTIIRNSGDISSIFNLAHAPIAYVRLLSTPRMPADRGEGRRSPRRRGTGSGGHGSCRAAAPRCGRVAAAAIAARSSRTSPRMTESGRNHWTILLTAMDIAREWMWLFSGHLAPTFTVQLYADSLVRRPS